MTEMVNGELQDELEAGLANLQRFDADPRRIERLRVRCLALLEAQRRRDKEFGLIDNLWRRLEPAVAFLLSALYLAAAVNSTLALLR